MAAGWAAMTAQALLALRHSVGSVPIAREAMVFEALVSIVSRIILLLLFVGVVMAKLQYVHFFVAAAIANGIGLLLAWRIMMRHFARPLWGVRSVEIAYLLKESAPVALYNFLGQCPMYLNVFLLKWLQDLEQVSYFQAPLRVIGPLMILPMSLLFAFTPAISRMGADVDRSDDLRRFYRKGLCGVLIVVLPLCAVVTVFAPGAVRLLFGADFDPSAASFRILFCAIAPFSLNAFLNTILTSLRKQRVVALIHLAALAINLAIGPWLTMRYGHCGASVAFLVGITSLFLMNHCFLNIQLRR